MGIFDKLFGELVDIVEWIDPSNDTMIYRFERYQNELKNGAKLIVRESQQAVFIEQGQVADVFGPGTYTLTTENLPILSTLRGWKHGFNSPFKAEVYFISTKQFTNLKWGTKSPITLRDPDFGPCRIRAFGNYCIRIIDPANFIKEITGTRGNFSTDEIGHQLRNLIITFFTDAIGEAKIPVLDLAANYHELGQFITAPLDERFQRYGLNLTEFLIENISLPTEVEKALDKRTSIGIIGDLNKFTQYQAGQSVEIAAGNTSGTASEGIGLGIGMAMASQMAKSFNQSNSQPAADSAPPPLPSAEPSFHVSINGSSAGPFTLSALQSMIASQQVTPSSLVWQSGMDSWQPAASQTQLAALFSQTPPPLPEL